MTSYSDMQCMTDGSGRDVTTDRVMIDIETLGTEPGCAILSVGGVRFSPEAVDILETDPTGDEFSRSVDVKSCQLHDLEIDAETLQWWQRQNDDVRPVLGGHGLRTVLEALTEWLDGADEVWAHSPKFDCAILERAYQMCGMTAPWEYYELRDSRTIAELDIAPDIEQEGDAHDALDDAKYQARVVAETLGTIHSEGGNQS